MRSRLFQKTVILIACLAVLAPWTPSVFAQGTLVDLADEHAAQILRRQNTVRVMAVGDIMMHLPIVNSVLDENGFNFEPVFSNVERFFSTADLVIGNLETTLTDEGGPFTGYPRFRSPASLVVGLARSGFNVLTTANNHALDYGSDGVKATLAALDSAGIRHTGSFTAPSDPGIVIKVRKVVIGITAYTYGTNGLQPSFDGEISRIGRERILEDGSWMEQTGVDLKIAVVHWGTEYATDPDTLQRDAKTWFEEAGFDLVLGAHPHVVQTSEITERQAIFYSLGNFLSNQFGDYTDVGVIADLVVEMTEEGAVIRRSAFIPTTVERTWPGGRIQYRIRVLEKNTAGSAEDQWNHINRLLGEGNR